ncbi:hypothetical protein LINGRAHAP2_LOCUS36673 [Linum grandiflorum]
MPSSLRLLLTLSDSSSSDLRKIKTGARSPELVSDEAESDDGRRIGIALMVEER